MEINKKILNFNEKTDLNVILVHHYFIRAVIGMGIDFKEVTVRE